MTETNQLIDAIKRGADAIDARTSFPHDRSQFMNASEAGTCIRRQWYGNHRPDSADPESWGFARRGKNIERWVVECLIAANVPLGAVGEEQVSLVDEEWRMAGTPDGYINFGDGVQILEIKSADPNTKLSSLPRPHHVAQLKINLAIYNKQYGGAIGGKIIYVNASNYDAITEFDVELPDEQFINEMRSRAAKLLDTKKVEVLDREGKRFDFGRECRYCPFRVACGVKLDEKEQSTGRKGTHLHAWVKGYAELKSAQDTSKAQLDDLRASIIAAMEKEGVSEKVFAEDKLKVSIQQRAGSKTLDKVKVAERLGDLEPYTNVGKPSVVLKVEHLA